MGVVTTYQTTDGKTWGTRAEANRHQKLLDAKSALTDLFTAGTDVSHDDCGKIATLLVDAADPISKILKGQMQPLEDGSVFSDLGLEVPSSDSEEAVEEEGDQDESPASEPATTDTVGQAYAI